VSYTDPMGDVCIAIRSTGEWSAGTVRCMHYPQRIIRSIRFVPE
jgi:hypothetical protein